MKRKIFTLLLAVVAFGWVSAQYSTMTINVASKPAVCDGVNDDKDPWVEGDWVNVAVGKESNVGDMSAKFQLKYDKDKLYFAAIVLDADRFTGNSTAYKNDCIEFFISMDTSAWVSAGVYHPDLSTKQLRLQAVADPEATGGAIDCGQTAPPSGEYVCADNGDNYVQEWSMPWEELSADMDPAWDQKQFRFDIQVANATADGARTQQMFWDNASDDQWRYTTRMGIVTLATPIPDLGGGPNLAAKMTIDPTSKTVVADGVIDDKDAWLADKWVDVAVGKENNVGDMSAKFQLTYNRNNLFFGAVVQDADRFTGNGTTYLNDCIEFFISMDTTTWENNGGNYHADLSTKQLRLQAVDDPDGAGFGIESGQTAPPSGTYTIVDNGDNYVQEWIMPWAELSADMDPAWDEMQFRFDIQVANATADGQRTQQMFWDNASDDQWRYTWRMAVVALSQKVSLAPTGIKNVSVAPSIYVDQNKQLQKVSGLVSVYDVTGKLVIKQYAKTGSISVASLKQGIYIVHTNNSSAKISIQ
jgi:hypothetical protein